MTATYQISGHKRRTVARDTNSQIDLVDAVREDATRRHNLATWRLDSWSCDGSHVRVEAAKRTGRTRNGATPFRNVWIDINIAD